MNSILRDRARMLQHVRNFFAERGVLEVDCPALLTSPSIDAHVEAMTVSAEEGKTHYLHTSPEYAMKKLLAAGSGDIFYLGHVFRREESSPLHSPEFTMIEWYRLGYSLRSLIEETCALIQEFVGALPIRLLSYEDALRTHADVDPFADGDFQGAARRLGIEVPSESSSWDRDTWLHLLMSHAIEPCLGTSDLTVLMDYPPSQAALARLVHRNGHAVAARFEIYHKGVELANGYHELADPQEQYRRCDEENQARITRGKKAYPIDEHLLTALAEFPDCCGVSVGFDRLMLLRHKSPSLKQILFPSNQNQIKPTY